MNNFIARCTSMVIKKCMCKIHGTCMCKQHKNVIFLKITIEFHKMQSACFCTCSCEARNAIYLQKP